MKSLLEIQVKASEENPTRGHILDIQTDHLLQFIPYPEIGYYLKPDVTEGEWEEHYRPLKQGNVIGVMDDYMKHAWDVILKGGLQSSRRVITHYHSWLWILEDTEAIKFLLDSSNFPCFGAPILHYICVKYNWELKSFMENWQYKKAQSFIEGVGC